MKTAAAGKSSGNTGSRRRIKIWMMFIVLFMSWATYTFLGQLKQSNATEIRLASVQKQLDESTEQSQQLQQRIDQLNDPEYIEQLATKEQGMVKEGEKVIEVIK